MKIVHKGLILVLVPLVLSVAVIGSTYALILRTDAVRLKENRERQTADNACRSSTGTGLGLPIAKQMVEQHGGEIGVVSKSDQGSTFWFRIPQTHEQESQPTLAELPPGAAR